MSLLRREADGRFGLVWRVVLVLVSASLVWLTVPYIQQTFFGRGYDRLGHASSAALTSVLIVPLIIFSRRYLDRRSLRGIGLPLDPEAWRSLVLGMGSYLIPATVGLVIVIVFGRVEIVVDAPLTEVVALLAGLVVLVLLFEALPEELIFRGYVYHNLNTARSGRTIFFHRSASSESDVPLVSRTPVAASHPLRSIRFPRAVRAVFHVRFLASRDGTHLQLP